MLLLLEGLERSCLGSIEPVGIRRRSVVGGADAERDALRHLCSKEAHSTAQRDGDRV